MYDKPYINLLLLILPAVVFVVIHFLIPMIEDFKFKRELIGKFITVIIKNLKTNKNLKIEGELGSVIDENLIEIKRKFRVSFKIPFLTHQFKSTKRLNCNTEYYMEFILKENDEFDENTGFKKFTLTLT